MKKILILTIMLLTNTCASAMNGWPTKEPNARALAAAHAPVRTALMRVQQYTPKKDVVLKALNKPIASNDNYPLPPEIQHQIMDYAVPHFSHNPEIENRWQGVPQLLRTIPVVSDPGKEPYASKLGWIYVSLAGSRDTYFNNYDQYEPLKLIQIGLLTTNHEDGIHFSPDETCVAINQGRRFYFHDLKNKNHLYSYPSLHCSRDVIFSPDNTKCAISDFSHSMVIFHVINLKDKEFETGFEGGSLFYFTNDSKYLITKGFRKRDVAEKTIYNFDTKELSETTTTLAYQNTKPRSHFNPAYEATLDSNNILTIRPFEMPNVLLQVKVPFNAKFLNFSRHGKTFRLYNKDTHEIYEYGFKSLHEQVRAEAGRKTLDRFNIIPTLPIPQQENINTEGTAQLNA